MFQKAQSYTVHVNVYLHIKQNNKGYTVGNKVTICLFFTVLSHPFCRQKDLHVVMYKMSM